MPDSMAHLLSLVEQLYAAAGHGEWEGFLGELAGALRGVIPALFVHERPTEAATLGVTVGVDPAWAAAYDNYYVKHDLRRRKIWALPAGSVFVGSALVPNRELVRSEFYNDFLRPHGYFHLAGAVPLKNEEVVAVLDWFPTAVLLLDRQGRIVASNRSAEELLASGDGLRADRDGLRAALPGETLALQ